MGRAFKEDGFRSVPVFFNASRALKSHSESDTYRLGETTIAAMALCLALAGLISGCCLSSSAISVAINSLYFFLEHLLDAISRNSFCTSKVGLMIGIQ